MILLKAEATMSEKGKSSTKGYVLLALFVVLVLVSITIAYRLFTADYPTHSDVFFMGVECGGLVVVLSGCLILACLLFYRLGGLLLRKEQPVRITSRSLSFSFS
jgi:hypothetical protein